MSTLMQSRWVEYAHVDAVARDWFQLPYISISRLDYREKLFS